MKKSIFVKFSVLALFVSLAIGGYLYSASSCPLEGTPDCPKIKTCCPK